MKAAALRRRESRSVLDNPTVGAACETISVFAFTGVPPVDVVRDNADCTLRDLDAASITTCALAAPSTAGVAGVRSSGYFNSAQQHIWAQYSTYVAGSNVSGEGRLIQHSLFVESSSLQCFNDDIAQLSNAVHHAFLATIQDTR